MILNKQNLLDKGFCESEFELENEKFCDFVFKNYLENDLSLASFCDEFNLDLNHFFKKLATHLNLEFLDINSVKIDEALNAQLGFEFLQKYEILAFDNNDDNINILTSKSQNHELFEQIQSVFRDKFIKFYLTQKEPLKARLNQFFIYENIARLSAKLREEWARNLKQDETSIAQIFNFITNEALSLNASDIHIEARKNDILVRIRVDGVLRVFCELESEVGRALVFYIKILSHLNVTQERSAQDGSFAKEFKQKSYDFRVSSLPLEYGESVVLRILRHDVKFDLESLSLGEKNLALLKKAITQPHGMILLTGPTGSGKSTTLYACLNAIKSVEKKIITAEDPIEYKIAGVSQIMLNEKAGLDFSNALRAILRQDPDIIMIGEIRDEESLDIAIKSALTGHLLLSTLHTNDAISAIDRLLNMRAKPYLIASSLSLIIAQRLLRKLCPHCRIKSKKTSEIKGEFYESLGCAKCSYTGFLGRELVSEFVYIDEIMASLIRSQAPKNKLLSYLKEQGFESIYENALNKARSGIISLDELFRCVK